MTIKELIDRLKEFNPNAKIEISNECLIGDEDEIEIWIEEDINSKEKEFAKLVYLSPYKMNNKDK